LATLGSITQIGPFRVVKASKEGDIVGIISHTNFANVHESQSNKYIVKKNQIFYTINILGLIIDI
jgi:hypothetical protein